MPITKAIKNEECIITVLTSESDMSTLKCVLFPSFRRASILNIIPNETIKLYEKQAKVSDNEHFIFRGNAFS
jgi:hypothetical protein